MPTRLPVLIQAKDYNKFKDGQDSAGSRREEWNQRIIRFNSVLQVLLPRQHHHQHKEGLNITQVPLTAAQLRTMRQTWGNSRDTSKNRQNYGITQENVHKTWSQTYWTSRKTSFNRKKLRTQKIKTRTSTTTTYQAAIPKLKRRNRFASY